MQIPLTAGYTAKKAYSQYDNIWKYKDYKLEYVCVMPNFRD